MQVLVASLAFVVVVAVPSAIVAQDSVTVQELSRIEAVMAELNCRIDPGRVLKQGNEFVLNDVFCADGQFDIRLDGQFRVIAKRVE